MEPTRIRVESNPHVITITAPRGWLEIAHIGCFSKPPNRWHRFWAWFLLGWRWDPANPPFEKR